MGKSDLPVVFVSTFGLEELVTKALDMEAVGYVIRPFSPSEDLFRSGRLPGVKGGLQPSELAYSSGVLPASLAKQSWQYSH